MVIGPWEHGVSRKTGDLDFGAEARVEREVFELPWFDYWLKGVDNGVGSAPVTLFVMAKTSGDKKTNSRWRARNTGKCISRAAATPTPTRAMAGFPGTRRVKPLRPIGIVTILRARFPAPAGITAAVRPPSRPRDQRPIESRDDVLVYTSEPMTRELEITGPVKVALYASCDAPNTDFVAKLIDVFPDGRAINMCEGIIRARYRESAARPKLLEPGRIYEFAIDLIGTSNVFLPGHRLRVDIASSHFPQFDRNPNTGDEFGTSARARVTRQTVQHSRAHPSHILLPVIP